jgi:hypothetical protein
MSDRSVIEVGCLLGCTVLIFASLDLFGLLRGFGHNWRRKEFLARRTPDLAGNGEKIKLDARTAGRTIRGMHVAMTPAGGSLLGRPTPAVW